MFIKEIISCVVCIFLCGYSCVTNAQIIHNNVLYHTMGENLICKGTIDSLQIGQSITLPDTIVVEGKSKAVTYIDNDAFVGAGGLQHVVLPNTIEVINSRAFAECDSLDSVFIPKGVKVIVNDAFDMSNLAGVSVSRHNRYYDSRNDCNAIIVSTTNELLVGSANTVIPTSVQGLGRYAFSKRMRLREVDIPMNVRVIGYRCFYSCNNLANVNFAGNDYRTVEGGSLKIDVAAFQQCGNIREIKLPERLDSIEGSAFSECNRLTNVTIPKKVSYIGGHLFAGCDNLHEVNVESGNRTYESRNNCRWVL